MKANVERNERFTFESVEYKVRVLGSEGPRSAILPDGRVLYVAWGERLPEAIREVTYTGLKVDADKVGQFCEVFGSGRAEYSERPFCRSIMLAEFDFEGKRYVTEASVRDNSVIWLPDGSLLSAKWTENLPLEIVSLNRLSDVGVTYQKEYATERGHCLAIERNV